MALADMLSRAPAPGDGTATDTTDVEIHAVSVVSSLVSERTALRLAQVDQLRDLSTNSVTERLGAMFSRYGIPTEVCTDNGPQFSSQVFARFAKLYDFQHVTSSPRFPRSNGLAEKGVQVVKRILKKSTEANEDFWLGLLSYRASPLEDGRPPGELLQRRRLRTPLPDFTPQPVVHTTKHKQTSRRHHTLPPLQHNDVVRVKGTSWSEKAKVMAPAGPRSFYVRTEGHKTLRRNREHLLGTKESFSPDMSASESDNEQDTTPSDGANTPPAVSPLVCL
ncbi:uncharacterized protein K02A2.6-like [Dermacentor silvarum]|uniref:uncharacterized protein K02A2.6-like n=1 Tax=Dermacentor silvarum TaxID=543639 RepID=UPI0021015277|nr:uncharacterized protein K02A2.6-like [Dermacentor silvarum]